jgi:hypothetical protein
MELACGCCNTRIKQALPEDLGRPKMAITMEERVQTMEEYLVFGINTYSPCSCTNCFSPNQLAEVTSAMLLDWLEFRSWSDRDHKYLSQIPSITQCFMRMLRM